jgi:hypothetical protein
MSEQEMKQILIDNYTNLLRIKAAETAENKELEIQLEVAKTSKAGHYRQRWKRSRPSTLRHWRTKRTLAPLTISQITGIIAGWDR